MRHRGPDPVENWQHKSISRRTLVTRSAASVLAVSAATSATMENGVAQNATPAASPITTPFTTSMASPEAVGIQLIAVPNPVRVDEPFDIFMYGLEPNQRVLLTSTFRFLYPEIDWHGSAVFQASSNGEFNASGQKPVKGTYDIPDAMGLVWGAIGTTGFPAGPAYTNPPPITITASDASDNHLLATVRVDLTFLNDSTKQINVRENGLIGTFFMPETTEPVPAILILGGSEGGLNPIAERTAALLASHGFAALALAYFGIGNLPRALARIPLEYFETAIGWLKSQPGVDPDRIGVMGSSRGGELALLLGSMFGDLKAVASYVGSGYVGGAYPEVGAPAWTWKGKPIPYATEAMYRSGKLASVEILVENTNGPLLLISADADEIWPSTPLSRVAWDRLQRLGHPFADQFLTYPGAGHMIFPPYLPLTGAIANDPVAQQAANVGAWRATLQMFNAQLKYG